MGTTVPLDVRRLSFLDGLLWYLETRNWAFEKLRTCPHGSQQLDIKMYHYLYFANFFGAVDLLRDYIKKSGEKLDFEDRVLQAFPRSDDYRYARELRNAIVHRGLDPAAAGHSDNNILYVLCPSSVMNQSEKTSYSCSFQYTVQLAERCNSIVNPAIFDFLKSHGFLDPRQAPINKDQSLEFIRNSTVMPDWAKAMAVQGLNQIDFDQMALEIATARVNNLKRLLGH